MIIFWVHFCHLPGAFRGTSSPKLSYDKDSANSASWFPKTFEFQSGHRVEKKGSKHLILCISWHTKWFNASKSPKPFKLWKSLISLYNLGSRPRKSLKIAKKSSVQICSICSIIWDSTWWILTSRGFGKCSPNMGRECLRPSYGRPKLTLVSRFGPGQLRSQKSKTLQKFSSGRSAINGTLTPIWLWWLQVLRPLRQKLAECL